MSMDISKGKTTHRKIRNTQKYSKIHNSASRVQRVHFSSTRIAHLPLFLLSVVTSVFICQAPRTGLKIFKCRTSKGSYMHHFLLHSTHSPVLLSDHLLRLNGNPLQYSCLENPMDRGVRQARVHGAAKTQTWISHISFMVSCLCFGLSTLPHAVFYTYFYFDCTGFQWWHTGFSFLIRDQTGAPCIVSLES